MKKFSSLFLIAALFCTANLVAAPESEVVVKPACSILKALLCPFNTGYKFVASHPKSSIAAFAVLAALVYYYVSQQDDQEEVRVSNPACRR